MVRLLIVLLLLMVLVLLVRSTLREFRKPRRRETHLGAREQLVQDPVCRTYVGVDSAIQERMGSDTYYFCSRDCADTFRRRGAG